MENISYGKIVLIGAGHVGSAILDSLLRMNLADEIVVINRNEKKHWESYWMPATPPPLHTVPTQTSGWVPTRTVKTPKLSSTPQVPAFSQVTPVTAWCYCRPMYR